MAQGRARVAARARPAAWDAQGSLALDELGLRLEAPSLRSARDYVAAARAGTAWRSTPMRSPTTFIVRPRRRGERFAPFGGPEERRLKSLPE